MCLYMYTCIHVDVQHFGANHMFQYMCLVCLLSLWVVCHSVAINYVTRCAFHCSYHYTGLDKSLSLMYLTSKGMEMIFTCLFYWKMNNSCDKQLALG